MRYVYITTNLVNDKKYIGQRKVPKNKTPENDSYLGSGTLLLRAIKKHGRKSFYKEIIKIVDSHIEADKLEIELINKFDACNSEDFYNIDSGGQFYRSENHTEISSRQISKWYSKDENFTISNLKKQRIRYKKGLNHKKWITRCERDLYFLKKKLIKENNSRNMIERNKVNELIINQIRKENQRTPKQIKVDMVRAAKKSWEGESKQNKRKSMVDAWSKRKQKFKDSDDYLLPKSHRSNYALARLKKANNYLGVYLIENGYIKLNATLQKKIKKAITQNYKEVKNFHSQVNSIIELINNDNILSINKDLAYNLIHKSRELNNIYNYDIINKQVKMF